MEEPQDALFIHTLNIQVSIEAQGWTEKYRHNYAGKLEHAWKLVEALVEKGETFTIHHVQEGVSWLPETGTMGGDWMFRVRNEQGIYYPTLAIAICHAAIRYAHKTKTFLGTE